MAVHIATCRFISKVFPSGRERSFLRPPISRAHRHLHVHAHAPTCPCRYSLCWIFPSYRCEASSFCAVLWRLRFEPPSDSLYRRRAMRALAVSVSLEPAREVACKDCTVPAFFLCVRCFHFRHFDRASLIWRRSRTDVPRIVVVFILWSLVLRIVVVLRKIYILVF